MRDFECDIHVVERDSSSPVHVHKNMVMEWVEEGEDGDARWASTEMITFKASRPMVIVEIQVWIDGACRRQSPLTPADMKKADTLNIKPGSYCLNMDRSTLYIIRHVLREPPCPADLGIIVDRLQRMEVDLSGTQKKFRRRPLRASDA